MNRAIKPEGCTETRCWVNIASYIDIKVQILEIGKPYLSLRQLFERQG